ncbi:unnamed protein product [Prorocentrum cordatum]|uniref:Uncharacterized protein n=1 Tax=Prorocentrum cordatum TaxID=2364126 RepID=A0ABN9QQC1_9DINO|nr:unnamed protein product [Polarella glacialis]
MPLPVFPKNPESTMELAEGHEPRAARAAEEGRPRQVPNPSLENPGLARLLQETFDNAGNAFGLRRKDLTSLAQGRAPLELIQAFFPAVMRATLRAVQGVPALGAAALHQVHMGKERDICKVATTQKGSGKARYSAY